MCSKNYNEASLLFSFRTLQNHHRYYPELRVEPKAVIHQRTEVFQNDVEALERKIFLEEIAVDIADERCDFLDKNLRWD